MATITELKDFAEAEGINLTGALDNKETIIARLNEQGADLDENGDGEALGGNDGRSDDEALDPSASDGAGGDDGDDPASDDAGADDADAEPESVVEDGDAEPDDTAIDEPDTSPTTGVAPSVVALAAAAGFTNRDPKGQLELILQQRSGVITGLTPLQFDAGSEIRPEDITDSSVQPRTAALSREELEHRIRTSTRRVDVVTVTTTNSPIDLPDDHDLSTRELMFYVTALERSGELSISAPEWVEFRSTAPGDVVLGYAPPMPINEDNE